MKSSLLPIPTPPAFEGAELIEPKLFQAWKTEVSFVAAVFCLGGWRAQQEWSHQIAEPGWAPAPMEESHWEATGLVWLGMSVWHTPEL